MYSCVCYNIAHGQTTYWGKSCNDGMDFKKGVLLAHRDKVVGSLCYTPGVGVRTWLKYLLQVLYLSYYLPYLHHTCMNDASGPSYGVIIIIQAIRLVKILNTILK